MSYVSQQWFYGYTGSEQSIQIPSDVKRIKIECGGAQGGFGQSGVTSGAGGYAYGEIDVNPGETLFIYVGGAGESPGNRTAGGAGGWNGGGRGGDDTQATGKTPGGGGGGGTDVRRGGNSIYNRIIVAGGGGGGGGWGLRNGWGGYGGGNSGQKGNNATSSYGTRYGGGGGTQSSGGTNQGNSALNGSYYSGGYGANSAYDGGGGGGGGYYGGAGGQGGGANQGGGGGGGGSGYIGGVQNGGMSSGAVSGSGYVIITSLVINVSVTGISLNKSITQINIGSSETLIANVTPLSATNKNVTWASSDNTIAIVDSTGKVTANSTKSGSCTITATTVDGGFVATCIVTVYIPVTSISLNKSSTTINKGGYETLVATIQPSNATNKNISWSSSNPNIATVDPNGKVSALTTGTARITVTTQDGNKTAYCDVTVYVDVTGITLDATEVTIEKGTSRTLVATISPSDAFDKRVTWSSSDNSIVAVDALGKVTGIAGGTATITATTVDGNKIAACIVHVHVAVNSITLAPAATDLHLIGKLQLTVTVFPEDATVKDVIWTVNSQDLASINTQGLLTAIAAGMVTVTVATVEGNFTATSRINIYQPIADRLTSFEVSSLYSRNKDVTLYSLPTVLKVINSNNLSTCFSVIQPYTQDGDKYGRNILTQFVVSKFSRLVGRFKVDMRPVTRIRLVPIKDSSINDILDTVTFGHGLEMLIGYHAPTDETYRSFIQFDTSSIPLKSNNIEILSAKLNLYIVGEHPAMTVEVINVTEDWFEYFIVWFNRPDTEDTYIKTFNIPEKEGWIELDFQEILCSWCGALKKIYGIVIQSTDEARDAYIRLYTRESEFSPYLVVTYRDYIIITYYWSDVWTDFTVRQESSKNLYTHFRVRQTGKSAHVARFSVVRSSRLATYFKVKQWYWKNIQTTFTVNTERQYAENRQTTFTVRQKPWYAEDRRTTFTVKKKTADYDKKTKFTVWYANNIPTRFKATYRSEFDTYTEFDVYYGKDVITTFKAKGPEKSSIPTRFTVREAAAVSDTFTLFDVVYAKPLKTLFKARQRSIHNKLTQFVVRKTTEYDKVTSFKIRVDRNNGLVTTFTVVRRMKAYAFIV